MAKIPVGPLDVTAAWLSDVLQADVRGCVLEQIAIGVGLLGRLGRARLDGGPGVPATVVVKLPTLDTTVRTELCEPVEFYLRRLVVGEVVNGRGTAMCEFELEDEAAAFAYAEERIGSLEG